MLKLELTEREEMILSSILKKLKYAYAGDFKHRVAIAVEMELGDQFATSQLLTKLEEAKRFRKTA
jgi:hypothetical protein